MSFVILISIYSGDVRADNREVIQSMNHSLGRLQAIPAILSAVIPFCSVEVTNQTFFKLFGDEFMEKVPPVIGTLMGIDDDLMERRYGKNLAQSKKKIINNLSRETYQSIKRDLLNPSIERKNICANFKAQILNGEWSLLPHVNNYFNNLKMLDEQTYNDSKKIFDLMRKIDIELKERSGRI